MHGLRVRVTRQSRHPSSPPPRLPIVASCKTPYTHLAHSNSPKRGRTTATTSPHPSQTRPFCCHSNSPMFKQLHISESPCSRYGFRRVSRTRSIRLERNVRHVDGRDRSTRSPDRDDPLRSFLVRTSRRLVNSCVEDSESYG